MSQSIKKRKNKPPSFDMRLQQFEKKTKKTKNKSQPDDDMTKGRDHTQGV
jgi:hypothetical protein